MLTFWQLMVPDFIPSDTHVKLAKILQDVLMSGESEAVSISCAPRIGKSSNTIRALAWASGNSEGGLNHIAATYGLTLSGKHKRLWNTTIESDEFSAVFGESRAKELIQPLFTSPQATGTGVAAGSERSDDSYRGAFLYDDMVKTITREPLPESIADWYSSVAVARRQKRNCSINIGTRFGTQDFSNLIRVTEGEYHPTDNPTGYRFMNFPALLESGESFCEELVSGARLRKLRDTPATSETFWVVYQGQPEKAVGLESPISLREYDEATDGSIVDTFCSIDTSKGISNPTAVCVFHLLSSGTVVLKSAHELWGLQSVSQLKTALDKLQLPKRGLVESVGFGCALPYTQVISNRPKRERLMVANSGLTSMLKMPGADSTRLEEQINEFGVCLLDDLADCASYAINMYHKLPALRPAGEAAETGSRPATVRTGFAGQLRSIQDQLAIASGRSRGRWQW